MLALKVAMRKIHLKRSVSVRHSLCGIAPDKGHFTTVELVGSHQPDNICKVCLRALQRDTEHPAWFGRPRPPDGKSGKVRGS